MSETLLLDPILFDAADARPLAGLSGARVVLMTRGGDHWFVRKAAVDATGSARLRRQLQKQVTFEPMLNASIRAPRVLGDGEVDGRFYFDMEFVRGTDGISFLRRATYDDVRMVADRLCGYLAEIAKRPGAEPPTSMFDALYTKLCEVHRRTGQLGGSTLSTLFLGLDRIHALSIRPTACHGDLTLENFVIDEHGIFWLLDFLDAPYEHWWQDVAKLHQDLEGGWYRRSHPPIASSVLDYLSRRLLKTATQHDLLYTSIHPLMMALTFARILPYARTPAESEFVTARIDHFARVLDTQQSEQL